MVGLSQAQSLILLRLMLPGMLLLLSMFVFAIKQRIDELVNYFGSVPLPQMIALCGFREQEFFRWFLITFMSQVREVIENDLLLTIHGTMIGTKK